MPFPALSDLSGLVALAQERDLDLRPVILRVQTDLFLAAPARDAETLAAFEALACGLVPTVDEETAAIVAGKLAPCPDAPHSVLLALARKGGEPRRKVIERAVRLTPALLAEAVADGSDPAPLLAARQDLDAAAAEELVERADPGIDRVLAANPGLPLTVFVRDTLLARARGDAELAQGLLRRPDLSAPERALLYDHADAATRTDIRTALVPFAGLRPAPTPRADAAAATRLATLAAAADRDRFAEALAETLGLPRAAWEFDRPERRDLLALGLAAAGVPEEECIRIFLTLDPAISRSVAAVFHLVGLVRSTPPAVARHVVESVLDVAAAPARGARLPFMHEGGAASRRESAGIRAPEREATPVRQHAEAG
jgi:uncharacterized protein (DUF2336 family)